MNFIHKSSILTTSQYGFRTNSSTQLATITDFYDKLLSNMNNSKYTCFIFLDLIKAFGSVDHKILLKKKLYPFGIRGSSFNLLRSYLSSRLICTNLQNKVFNLCAFKYGVPQGSVLGPILFAVYK